MGAVEIFDASDSSAGDSADWDEASKAASGKSGFCAKKITQKSGATASCVVYMLSVRRRPSSTP